MFLQPLLPRLRLHEFLHFLLRRNLPLLFDREPKTLFSLSLFLSLPFSFSLVQAIFRLEPPLRPIDQPPISICTLSIISVCLASLFDEDGSLFPRRFDVVFDSRSRSSIVLRDVHRAAGSPRAVSRWNFRDISGGGAQLLKTAWWVGRYFEILLWKGSGCERRKRERKGNRGWLGVSGCRWSFGVVFGMEDFYFWTADATQWYYSDIGKMLQLHLFFV